MKRVAIAFGIGVCLPFVFALYLGGETLTQAGLRLTAVEQGFSLAAHHWEFEAVPAHQEPVAVAQIENVPAVKGKKVRR